jgi:ATP-dependent Clp protease ATP-binding subunit ClpA
VQLALRDPGPILLEGEEHAVRVLLGREPDLEAEYFVLPIAEPTPDQLRVIVDDWAASRAGGRGIVFEPAALTVARELSNRFLARNHQPRAVLDVLDQVAATARGPVSDRDVVERFIDAFRVPRILVDHDEPFDVLSLANRLRASVLEQDEAVDAVVRMVARIRAGLADPRRPFGAFLLVGPTGVGKTLIAQVLAEQLFGSRDHLVRVNLGDYPGPWDDDELFGDPDAPRLADRRGLLTARLQGHNVARAARRVREGARQRA